MTDITLILLLNSFYLYLSFKYFCLAKDLTRRFFLVEWAVWGFLLVILNLCGYLLTQFNGTISLLAMMVVSVLLIMIFIFLFFLENSIEKEASMKAQIEQQQADYQKHRLQEVEREQTYIRKMRHEMKNLLAVIEAFAEKEDYEGILALVRERQQQLAPSQNRVKTGNIAVDTILNYKIPKADMFGITMQMNLNIPTKMNVEDIVLCGVLGNAIDNAVEASKKITQDKRHITVNMKVEKRNLFIEVVNAYDGFIMTGKKGEILTRKGEVSNHGFGLPVIRQLIEKCNGNLDISWNDSQFFLRILIYHVL